MDPNLYRLVYFSKNRIVGGPSNIAREVEAILRSAERNNSRLGITGALIFNAGIFAQVLEGSRDSIEVTFEKIQQDIRHGDVQVLAFEVVRERVFARWSMGYFGQSREGQDLFGHIAAATGFTTAGIEGARMFKIVRDIAFEEEARAA
ncbi:MAG TPA: BLUF domain-containing protein [Rhodopseudomonas sp.]|uniref:BLUF domain-containing protein n=1 Tax=Rhodopseudomonas sp. TaxID=1078 RepID=UPI002ED79344